MKIGLLETIPILRYRLIAEKTKKNFSKKIIVEKARFGQEYDLIVSDLVHLPEDLPFRSGLILVPGHARIGAVPEDSILLTGGMNREDAVTFSSIAEEKALLCLQKEIFYHKKSVLPFEMPVLFDRGYGIYHNLASGFVFALANLVFGEDL
jgi:hypothetical protein